MTKVGRLHLIGTDAASLEWVAPDKSMAVSKVGQIGRAEEMRGSCPPGCPLHLMPKLGGQVVGMFSLDWFRELEMFGSLILAKMGITYQRHLADEPRAAAGHAALWNGSDLNAKNRADPSVVPRIVVVSRTPGKRTSSYPTGCAEWDDWPEASPGFRHPPPRRRRKAEDDKEIAEHFPKRNLGGWSQRGGRHHLYFVF